MSSIGHRHIVKDAFKNHDAKMKLGFSDRHVFLYLISLRIVNVFLVQTSFVPDEYWQSLEVAHNSVFGYGYLTWEWKYGLRSFVYPAIFTLPYSFLKYTGLDGYPWILINLPRLVQGCLSAVSDRYLFLFAKQHFEYELSKFALLSCITSWFWWYCATRTIINTLESTALCIGLYYYPWRVKSSGYRLMKYQLVAISICVVRPTAAIIWVPLALWHLWRSPKLSVLSSYALFSLLIFAVSSGLDRYFYGEWISVHWNFFTFNVLKNLGVHYGSHPWHWYWAQGVPVVLGPQLIFFLHGVLTSLTKRSAQSFKTYLCLITLFILNVTAYSFISHKEFRFILHLIPVASIFCGCSISHLTKRCQKFAIMFLIISNLPIALYFGLFHQRGSLAITNNLRNLLVESCNPKCDGGVLYLTPCHTTPLYAHLHANVTTRLLECPPNLEEKDGYQDEADKFYKDPETWLNENILTQKTKTLKFRWIVIFDLLYLRLKRFAPFERYQICSTEFHSHAPEVSARVFDMTENKLLKDLPCHNPSNFANFKSDSSKTTSKKLMQYLPTEDFPVDQVIVSDRSNILLRYLYLQLDKKLNGDAEKRKGDDPDTENTENGQSSLAGPSDGPPRKQARITLSSFGKRKDKRT